MKKKPGTQLNGRVRRPSKLLHCAPIEQTESIIVRAAKHGRRAAMEGKPRRVPADFVLVSEPLPAIAWLRAWDEGRRIMEGASQWLKSDNCRA